MKKLFSILLVCFISVSVFVACGEKDEPKDESYPLTQEEPQNIPQDDNGSEKPKNTEEPLAVSENKDIVTKDTAPEVHIITNGGTENASISYHLKDCKLLSETEHQKVTWEMIEMIQFRQCPECNPPRYKDYVE